MIFFNFLLKYITTAVLADKASESISHDQIVYSTFLVHVWASMCGRQSVPENQHNGVITSCNSHNISNLKLSEGLFIYLLLDSVVCFGQLQIISNYSLFVDENAIAIHL